MIEAILDRVLVSNVAFVEHGEPVCIPMLYARIDGKLYIHGSRASRAMRILARGEPGRVSKLRSDARARIRP